MRNVMLVVAYDGAGYHGFQEQRGSGLVTIQEVIEQALYTLAGKKIRIIGAARTDAGVHARGQVINFDASGWSIPTPRIPLALNGLLPEDIVILDAQDVCADFHARFSALAKTYRYTVYSNNVPSPFWRLYSYFTPRSLDVRAMSIAAGVYEGERDFASFKAAGTVVKSTVRTLFKVDVRKAGKLVYLTFRGNGFLYHMVRIMVGTLLEVGLGKRLPGEVEQILKACDRKLAGFTVPARGLCLEQVEYE